MLKDEAMRVILLPFSLDAMRAELVALVHWYDARPHQSFGGRTPAEVYAGESIRERGPSRQLGSLRTSNFSWK